MKVKMLRDKNGEMEAQLSAQTDVKGGGAAPGVDALKQKFGSSCWSISDGDQESTKPQRGIKLRPEGAAWDEDTEGRGDPENTCFMGQILSSFQVFRIGSVLMLEQLTPKSQKEHTHAYTHSLRTCKRTVVSEAPLAYTCTKWNTQLLGQEREKPESRMGFSCLYSEVTQVTTPTFYWPE